MSEDKETTAVITCQTTNQIQAGQIQSSQGTLTTTQFQAAQIQANQGTLTSTHLQAGQIQTSQMQTATATQQTIVPQASPQQVQQQGISQNNMAQVMSQGPQPAQSPHAVTNNMPTQSPQQASFYMGRFNNVINQYLTWFKGHTFILTIQVIIYFLFICFTVLCSHIRWNRYAGASCYCPCSSWTPDNYYNYSVCSSSTLNASSGTAASYSPWSLSFTYASGQNILDIFND